MKVFFKYMGGKSREISRMPFPENINRVIEPFAGSAAVAFHLEKPSIVTDINADLINCLLVVKDQSEFYKFYDLVETHKTIGPSEKEYYKQRDILNDKSITTPLTRAFAFLYVRQLCFSGMDRISKSGKFNVPFGWGYKKFNTSLSELHHKLLQQWDIKCCSFEISLSNIRKGDFIFIDPPYFNRLSDYSGKHDMGVSEELHIKLFNILNSITEKWLVVHVDCDLYQDLYKDYHIKSIPFTYSMNFMGRKSNVKKVSHLYITNYDL